MTVEIVIVIIPSKAPYRFGGSCVIQSVTITNCISRNVVHATRSFMFGVTKRDKGTSDGITNNSNCIIIFYLPCRICKNNSFFSEIYEIIIISPRCWQGARNNHLISVTKFFFWIQYFYTIFCSFNVITIVQPSVSCNRLDVNRISVLQRS